LNEIRVHFIGVSASIMSSVSQNIDFNAALLTIKFPQLIGIIAGCAVFTITISVVLYLLYASGSFSKLAQELRDGDISLSEKIKSNVSPQFSSQPELYDDLLQARRLLPIEPAIGPCSGKRVTIRKLNSAGGDLAQLVEAGDGRALFGESDYDPSRIWGWLNMEIYLKGKTKNKAIAGLVWKYIAGEYVAYLEEASGSASSVVSLPPVNATLVVVDVVVQKVVGMLLITDNCPHNLSARLGKMTTKLHSRHFCF
jgi:hypothetical protein